MKDIIIDLQNADTWKIQLTIKINFISSKNSEEHVMHSNSENITFTSYNDANKVDDELFESLRSRCQDNLEKSVTGIKFIFDLVHKVNFRPGSSCIDSPDWIKRKN